MIVIIIFGAFVALLCVIGVVLQYATAALTWFRFRDSATVRRNIPYLADSTNPKQRLDIYLPKKLRLFPIVIFVHGGYWTSGDKQYRPKISGLYGNIGLALAAKGIGCVIPNYRLAPQTDIAGQVSDIKKVLTYTRLRRGNWGGNGSLSLMGHSSGGHIISLLIDDPANADITQFIALSPVFDVEAMAAHNNDNFNKTITYPVFGTDSTTWKQYSPLQRYIANHTDITRLHVLYGARDIPYIREQLASAKQELARSGQNLQVKAISHLNHRQMVVDFGKRSNPLLKTICGLVKSSKP